MTFPIDSFPIGFESALKVGDVVRVLEQPWVDRFETVQVPFMPTPYVSMPIGSPDYQESYGPVRIFRPYVLIIEGQVYKTFWQRVS